MNKTHVSVVVCLTALSLWSAPLRGSFTILSVPCHKDGALDYDKRAGRVAFRRTEDFAPLEIGPRRRSVPDTLLFAEFQVKYGMFHNYLHQWIDRPLFWDRALRPNDFRYETADSLAVHARELKNAGLDGFNLFVSKKRIRDIIQFKEWLSEKGFKDCAILPTLGYGDDGRRTADPEGFIEVLKIAKADPTFPRINGKILLPTYNYTMFKPAEHRVMIEKLNAAVGKGTFSICGTIDDELQHRLSQAYERNGRLSAAETAELEKGIIDVLEIADGLQLLASETKRPYDGQYCSIYDFSFFDTCMVPAIERVYARPEHQNKVLGFYVLQGYINHMSGNDKSEDCTGTLRRFLRSVIRTNPDYLLFFEWNEVNENTMYQPTVWGGRTAPRILRWHSRYLKGLAPDPYPGDDTSVPPVGLTYRALAKPGEELHFELLNIPDGVVTGSLKVQLELKRDDGATVATFPVEEIDATRFGAVNYQVDTLGFSVTEMLVPTLEVNGHRYEGFAPVRFDPTVSWNYKTVRQFLRDLLVPMTVETTVSKRDDGRYAFGCKAEFPEKLASLELVGNEDELAAMGMEHEYDFESNHVVQLQLSTTRERAGWGLLEVKVNGAKGCRFTPHYTANVNSGVPTVNADASGFKVHTLFWGARIGYFLQIPKSVAPEVVKIEVSRPDKQGWQTVRLPLDVILSRGAASGILNEASSFRVDADRMMCLPDLPPHLKVDQVDWRGTVTTGTRYPVFHFRAISENGKIWRSRPFRPDAVSNEMVKLPAFDEYAKRHAEATVPAAMVPAIDYVFDPATGSVLVNTWDPFYNAWLGGGTWYCEPFSDPRIVCQPGCRVPKWVTDDGHPALEFDGINDYINFPKEAFPQGPFTLMMEIKPVLPTHDVPMVLFRHFEFTRGSISVFIDCGNLVATWGDRNLDREPRIDSGLKVRANQWNDISISYDLRLFTIKVNDETFAFPWEGRPFRFKPSVFGGHDKVELSPRPPVQPVYYCGRLRKIAFWHHPYPTFTNGTK